MDKKEKATAVCWTHIKDLWILTDFDLMDLYASEGVYKH